MGRRFLISEVPLWGLNFRVEYSAPDTQNAVPKQLFRAGIQCSYTFVSLNSRLFPGFGFGIWVSGSKFRAAILTASAPNWRSTASEHGTHKTVKARFWHIRQSCKTVTYKTVKARFWKRYRPSPPPFLSLPLSLPLPLSLSHRKCPQLAIDRERHRVLPLPAVCKAAPVRQAILVAGRELRERLVRRVHLVWGLGWGVWVMGYGVWGLGFGVWVLGCFGFCLDFRFYGLRCIVHGIGLKGEAYLPPRQHSALPCAQPPLASRGEQLASRARAREEPGDRSGVGALGQVLCAAGPRGRVVHHLPRGEKGFI